LHPKNPRLRERPVKLRTLVRSRTLSADFYDYPKWYEEEEKRYVIPEELISNTENVMKALRLKRIEE